MNCWTLPFRNPVYPRWRGEHCPRFTRNPSGYGLSPLARGTPTTAAN
ncbi:hypothetical protein DAQ1742_00454 [Dickeya aquatica]|uniref:Uncharacterized protein n=1 Tax=Dickeya aquatica TaxID=1401087 RepID=A0A375A691_9GAMM|nr:hypothetical protein DAQ1742_00454 [Dickeya aquatica]